MIALYNPDTQKEYEQYKKWELCVVCWKATDKRYSADIDLPTITLCSDVCNLVFAMYIREKSMKKYFNC